MMTILIMLTLAIGEAVATPVVVTAEGNCPAARAVDGALRGLLPAGGPPAAGPDVADLRADGDRVVVRLRTADGSLVAEKPLPPALSCAERADAAAVILASWQARLQSGARASLPLPPDEPARLGGVPSLVVMPPAAAVPTGAPVVRVATPAGSPPELIRAPPPPATAMGPGADWRIAPGIGGLGSVQGSDLGTGGLLEAQVGTAASPFSVGFGAMLVVGHDQALGVGRAAWWRAGAVVDGRWRWRSSALDVEPRLALMVARIAVEGRDFPSNGRNSFLDVGGLAAIRLLPRRTGPCPWLELGAGYWPRRHALMVAGVDREATIPALELLLVVGVTFGRPG